ncbi:MAG: hypothetical protein C0485_07905 [Pirellula sp.]|nr:hypothetical protein [Pirellula sp.]
MNATYQANAYRTSDSQDRKILTTLQQLHSTHSPAALAAMGGTMLMEWQNMLCLKAIAGMAVTNKPQSRSQKTTNV